jgi:hypothetical protein
MFIRTYIQTEMESMREDSKDNLNVEGGNGEDSKEAQVQEDNKEESKDSSKRIDGMLLN